MSRSTRSLVLLFIPIVSGAVAALGITACGAFGAASLINDPSPEAAASDAPAKDEASAGDGAVLDGGCRGPFQAPRTIDIPDSVIGTRLRSLRGVENGNFLISYDKSPDENLATAILGPGGLTLATPNPFASFNSAREENSPTGPSNQTFVVFASDRLPSLDGAPSPLRLWITQKAATGFGQPEHLSVSGVDGQSDLSITNPYLVDGRIYFDLQNVLSSGDLMTSTRSVINVKSVPGGNDATHPVVTKDQRELFAAVVSGIQLSSRSTGSTSTFGDPSTLSDSAGFYPTWISDDACQLYAIDPAVGELHVYDRQP